MPSRGNALPADNKMLSVDSTLISGLCGRRCPRFFSVVGRSRYAQDSQVLAARINLHEHILVNEGVILQPFVTTRQQEFIIDRGAPEEFQAQGFTTEDHRSRLITGRT